MYVVFKNKKYDQVLNMDLVKAFALSGSKKQEMEEAKE